MKILVGVKHVPDTETKIKVGPDGRSIDPAGVKWIVSPYDEYAIEEALKIREAAGDGEVVLVCAGPSDATATLRQGLAMGADRAIHVEDDRLDRADGLTRAETLAAVAKTEEPTLVLLGKHGVGTDEGQTVAMLGEVLGWPHVGAVGKLDLAADGFTAHREIEGGVEVHEGRLPAVLGIDKGINEPRYASLKGIVQAKKKKIEARTLADLGVDEGALGGGARVVWESLELPPAKPEGRRLEGEPDDQVRELVRVLREEVKVI